MIRKEPGEQMELNESWCERGELNPYPLRDWILSPARLPIPPLSHRIGSGKIGPQMIYLDVRVSGNFDFDPQTLASRQLPEMIRQRHF